MQITPAAQSSAKSRDSLRQKWSPNVHPYLIWPLEVLKGSIIFLRHIRGIHTLTRRCWVIVIEVTRVRSVFHLRNNGAFHLAVVESLPIDTAEEGVGLDSTSAARDVAKSAGRIDRTEAANEVLGVSGHPTGIADIPFDNPDACQLPSRLRRGVSHISYIFIGF